MNFRKRLAVLLIIAIILLIIFLWFIGFLSSKFTSKQTVQKKIIPFATTASPTSRSVVKELSCQVNIIVPLPGNTEAGLLRICEDMLVLDYPPRHWDITSSRYDTILDTKESFYDLFFVKHGNSSEQRIPQTVNIYETKLGAVILVAAHYIYGSANHKGSAVYIATQSAARRIYQLDSSIPYNAAWIGIYKADPLVIEQSGTLAPLGSNSSRPGWTDLYGWNDKLQKIILVNNQYPEVFKKLLESYKHFDENACWRTGLLLTEAYKQRKNEVKICGEDEEPPYVTSEYTKEFLQARETARRIIQGENLSFKDIETIQLDY